MKNYDIPAFPTENERQTGSATWHFSGLTKREYFAAVALQGLLADPSSQLDHAAHNAVVAADLLLRELNGEDVRPVIKYVPVREDIPY